MTARSRYRITGTAPMILGTSGTTGFPQFDKTWKYTSPFSESCFDETHIWPPRKINKRIINAGGPLMIWKKGYKYNPSSVFKGQIGLSWFNSRFIPSIFSSQPVMPANASFFGELATVDGTSGWNKFAPGKPVADVGQLIGESIEFFPSVPFMAIKKAHGLLNKFRATGSEYLNVQFGWKPLVRDIQNIYHLSRTLDSQISQLRRDNNREIRRRGSVRSDVIDSFNKLTTGIAMYPAPVGQFTAGCTPGQRNDVLNYTDKAWFSAQFKYHIRDVDSVAWENRAVLALFGLNPSPSLLWELLPWSWLFDWALNVGDVLSNMSTGAADNLVANYAYVMRNKLYDRTVTESKQYVDGDGVKTVHTASVTLTWEQKLRTGASPFGFGLVPGDLTGRQALILSALGISRRW